jgi:hypothetical protein
MSEQRVMSYFYSFVFANPEIRAVASFEYGKHMYRKRANKTAIYNLALKNNRIIKLFIYSGISVVKVMKHSKVCT